MSESNLRTAMDDLSNAAKSRFAKLKASDIKAFVEAQPEVRGTVEIDELSHLEDGAGASNGIAFFTATFDLGDGKETRQLIARYQPGESLLQQKVFSDEFKTVKVAGEEGLSVPRVHWLDADGEHLRFPGYVGERVIGESPAPSVFEKGILATVSANDRRSMMLAVAGFHGRLRGKAIGPDKVPHLAKRGSGTTPIERELGWWLEEARLVGAETTEYGTLVDAYNKMIAAQPDAYASNLVHGDAQFCNHMFKDGKLQAVIDWELSFLGHNESDLALIVFLAETQQSQSDPLPGVPKANEFIEQFESEAGAPVQHWEFFQAFNNFKFASAITLSRKNLPSFEPVWEYYRALRKIGLP